jgi:hypothetical protein
MDILPPIFDSASVEKHLEEAEKHTLELQEQYRRDVVPFDEIGTRSGPVDAVSLLSWNRLAQLANIPHVSADIVSRIPIDDAWASMDGKDDSVSPTGLQGIELAIQYARSGGFWRTDQCASCDIKYAQSTGKAIPSPIPFYLDDPRIMDLHHGIPEIIILGRPRLTPVMVGGYPLEFRVFLGGLAHPDGAVSYYYPQANAFDVSSDLERFMDDSLSHARDIYSRREQLCLVPRLLNGHASRDIGATIDFMVTQEMGLVMIDAGPGAGYGAHPCCFVDLPVEGKRWRPKEGLTINDF